MEPITFLVPAIPVAQPRQRSRIASIGGKLITQNYTPKKSPVSDYKATVRLAAEQAYKGAPIEGPLRVRLLFVFPSQRKSRKPKPTKPDCDNLAKSTLDALNGLTFKDDGQVVDLRVQKWHAAADEQPHVQIQIEDFNGPSGTPVLRD